MSAVSVESSLGALSPQVEAVRATYPGTSAVRQPDGTVLVTVPTFPLPPGWTQGTTTVVFVAPVGFPMARPDCFWADATLRLANGAMPANSGLTAPPGLAVPHLWFSWHVTTWNPVTDGVRTYLGVIADRFGRAN